jgi:hypothetical protein
MPVIHNLCCKSVDIPPARVEAVRLGLNDEMMLQEYLRTIISSSFQYGDLRRICGERERQRERERERRERDGGREREMEGER